MKYLGAAEKVSSSTYNFFYMSFLALPQKGLVRLNLSSRETQNFQPLREAVKVPHFGFPLSAGPENGRATPPFKYKHA